MILFLNKIPYDVSHLGKANQQEKMPTRNGHSSFAHKNKEEDVPFDIPFFSRPTRYKSGLRGI